MAMVAACKAVAVKSTKSSLKPILATIVFMDWDIIAFLKRHHILNLAVRHEEELHAATCFYRFDSKAEALLFASHFDTLHIRMALENPHVAGTIHHCSEDVTKIRGVQFRGILMEADERQRRLYFHRFAMAKAMDPPIWAIGLEWIKYTDNRFGFGKKIIWNRRSKR